MTVMGILPRVLSRNDLIDGAVVDYNNAVPTSLVPRRPIVGETVHKYRTNQSYASVGKIEHVHQNGTFKVTGIQHAHPGDSGQLYHSERDGRPIGVHLEGHTSGSQDSTLGVAIDNVTFPNL